MNGERFVLGVVETLCGLIWGKGPPEKEKRGLREDWVFGEGWNRAILMVLHRLFMFRLITLDTRKELDQFFCINAVRYLKLVEIWDQTLVHIRFFFFSYSLIYASLTVALLLYRSCVLYQL